ncbi:hypothetical protein LA080_006151 [Diaporthe eres]|nr:hypothetical protein LA080_006151 [Diaporthe eres]
MSQKDVHPETSSPIPAPATFHQPGANKEATEARAGKSTGPGGWLSMRAPERATLAANQENILIKKSDQGTAGAARRTYRGGSACARKSRSRGSPLPQVKRCGGERGAQPAVARVCAGI